MMATNLHLTSTGAFLKPFLDATVCLAATSFEKSALSHIFAAVSPVAKHGQYYGPIGKAESGSKLSIIIFRKNYSVGFRASFHHMS